MRASTGASGTARRREGIHRLGRLTGLLTVCAALVACTSEPPYEDALVRLDIDVDAVVKQLPDLTVVERDARVNECANHGSGPIPPGRSVRLSLNRGVELDAVTTAVSRALTDRGYEPQEPDFGRALVGRRNIDSEWSGEIFLIPPNAQEEDVVLAAGLIPRITC